MIPLSQLYSYNKCPESGFFPFGGGGGGGGTIIYCTYKNMNTYKAPIQNIQINEYEVAYISS